MTSTPITIVDSVEAVATLMSTLVEVKTYPKPSLYIDLEGINLCRHGSISVLSLFIEPLSSSYLIDVQVLGASAFATPCPETNKTFKSLLEDPLVKKVFFDVRNDSDALFSLFGIRLQGVIDLQLLELGSRGGPIEKKRLVSGLSKAIKEDTIMTFREKKVWEEVKAAGLKLFAPERGGKYEVFNERPLRQELEAYCVQDVQYLPMLWERYTARLENNQVWKRRIEVATLERVSDSQSRWYIPDGRHKALGPWKID